jgi:LacI family transcriptional regulator
MTPRRVALLFHRDLAFCRGVLAGIEDWLLETGANWRLRHAPSTNRVMPSLREWQAHGVLGHVFEEGLAKGLTELQLPWVNTTLTIPWLNVPAVDAHHSQVGRMAADYLLERSFRSFGFFGNKWALFSRLRELGFRQRLQEAGFDAVPHYADYLPMRPTSSSWVQTDAEMSDWLQALPKPVAVFCCHDVPACDLIEACANLELRVPEDVAILGVDNDRFECEMAHPTLSSIALPTREIGRTAAALLDQAMRAEAVSTKPQLISPTHVVARRSTDMHAVTDACVQRALTFLKARSGEDIGVNDVAEAAGLSRRQLERRFRDALGRTVLNEIHRLRVERALKLLAESNMKIDTIAYRVGFSGSRQMADVFRKLLGKAPSQFRNSASPTPW